MPCTSALHLPLHGPVPLWALLSWLEGAPLGDPHGEEKGDLGRGGKGWNMLGPEPALDIQITCASDVALTGHHRRAWQHTIRPVGLPSPEALGSRGVGKLTGDQQSCGLASFRQRCRGANRPLGTTSFQVLAALGCAICTESRPVSLHKLWRSQGGEARVPVPGEPMSGMRASAWGEAPSAERGDVGLEWCEEKEACLGGGRLPWAGSLGRSTLRLLKSRPGGITLIRGIIRPARRLARSTASSFTSYLQAHSSAGLRHLPGSAPAHAERGKQASAR